MLGAKQVAFRLLQGSPCLEFKLRSIQISGAMPILNLHRVGEPRVGGYPPLDAAIFEELLGWLAQRFEIVVFGDLEGPTKGEKPPLILSFDDGYKDFIEIAVPILDRRRIRVNHNIVPGCVTSGRPPMNVELQDFIASAPATLLRETPLPGLPSGADPDQRERSCLRASAALKAKPVAEQKSIFAELVDAFARFDGFRATAMMTLDDIRQLTRSHEFGAHSFEHASMDCESDEYLREDAYRCAQFFETKLGFTPEIYAFPNGRARQEQTKIIAEAGYRHVLLVGEDYSRTGARLHPRFTLRAESGDEARARALGWFRGRGAR